MRRYRERHRKGVRSVRVYLQRTDLEVLITKGYLDRDSGQDPSAVQAAANMFISDVLFMAAKE
jgi:hypothetical protein